MGETILVLGGARSGKSRLAESLAAGREPVSYVATASVDPNDPEMVARVERHRARRLEGWTTHEVSRDLADVLPGLTAVEGSVLVDCVTLWVSNLLVGLGGLPAEGDDAILSAVDRMTETARLGRARVVWVSNEVGSGVIPANPLARRFADLQGWVNQRLASTSDVVRFCVAGLSLRLK